MQNRTEPTQRAEGGFYAVINFFQFPPNPYTGGGYQIDKLWSVEINIPKSHTVSK